MSGRNDDTIWVDEFGRCFCAKHRREHCDECCLSFDMSNRYVEQEVGLRRPPTQAEELATRKVMLERGIKFLLENLRDGAEGCRENLKEHYLQLQGVESELKKLRRQPGMQQEIQQALDKENTKARSHDADLYVAAQAMALANPGLTRFEVGGGQAQQIYEQFVAPPPSAARDPSVDPYTCSFCCKLSTVKMAACGHCKKQAYCSRTCQRAHWKAHKKLCKPVEQMDPTDEKGLPLTWEQLEAFGKVQQGARGQRIELRYIAPLEGSSSNMAALCKDRTNISMRVESTHPIPNFRPGNVMSWKHPRFHRFPNGSGGALIEETDLATIKIVS